MGGTGCSWLPVMCVAAQLLPLHAVMTLLTCRYSSAGIIHGAALAGWMSCCGWQAPSCSMFTWPPVCGPLCTVLLIKQSIHVSSGTHL